MNESLNNTWDSYNFKNGTIIIVDIRGFTKLVYNRDLATGKNITLSLLSSIIRNNRIGLSIAEIEGDAIFFYKFGKSPSHGTKLLAPFLERQANVERLINRSFLDAGSKSDYLLHYNTKRN